MISFSDSTEVTRGDVILVYGESGLGKTTFALGAPNAVLLSLEGGEDQMVKRGVAAPTRIQCANGALPKSWPVALGMVQAYRDYPLSQRRGEWFVVDAVTKLWEMCYAHTLPEVAVKDRGWGKLERAVFDEFKKFLVAIEDISRQGVGVILTSHARLAKDKMPGSVVEDPQVWVPALCSVNGADASRYLLETVCDVALFFARDVLVTEVGDIDKTHKTAATGSGKIVVRTRRGHGYLAKCRYPGVDDPIELSADPRESWNRFWSQALESETQIRESIAALMPSCPDAKRADAERATASATSLSKLLSIRNQLKRYEQEKRA